MSRSPTLHRLAAGLALAAALVLLPAAAAEASPGTAASFGQGLDSPASVGWLWKAVSRLLDDGARQASGVGSSPRQGSVEVKAGGEMDPAGQPQPAPPPAPQAGWEMDPNG